MNEPVTVTYSLEEIFSRLEQKIESNQKETNEQFKELNNKLETIQKETNEQFKEFGQKLETLQKDVTDLKIGQATLTEKLNGMDNRLEKVETTQINQVWALIVLLFGAIATASARFFFTGNP